MNEQRPKSNDKGSINPLTILKQSMRAVPAMKYALAVLGLVAVVAIVTVWRVRYDIAIYGAIVILGLMIMVLVFARLASFSSKHFLGPAQVLMWGFVILTIVIAICLFTAAAFRWPQALFERIFEGNAQDNPEQGVKFEGIVKDKRGYGIPSALIVIPGKGADMSSDNGKFEFMILTNRISESYQLEVSCEGYNQTNVTVAGPIPTPISVNLSDLTDVARITNQVNVETKLLVEFAFVHVYLDGSWKKDNWTVWGEVNGRRTPIWNKKKDISDNCNQQFSKGPNDDKSACEYSLGKTIPVTITNDGTLTIAFSGMANNQHDEVERSEETFTAAQNWGVGGETWPPKEKKYRRMGASNAGQTEYWMYYRVIKP